MLRRYWLAGVLAVVSCPAWSQPPDQVPVTASGMLERMDRNGDGRIDYEEYRNSLLRRFGHADRDDDGVLKGNEVPKNMVVVGESRQASGDVRFDDYTDALRPVFDRFDANRDGILEPAEIESYARARAGMKEEGR